MQSHISKVTSACFYHLRKLRQIRNYVTQKVVAQLVTSLIISRLDYCNSVFTRLPASTLAPSQRVQNTTRLVLKLDQWLHITSAVALAARQVPHHLQDLDADAPHSIRSMSIISEVIANHSCSREMVTDPIRQMHFLRLWSQYMVFIQ